MTRPHEAIMLEDAELETGWAIREATCDEGEQPTLVLYQEGGSTSEASPPEVWAYYHCHLPTEPDALIGLALVLMREVHKRFYQ